MLIYNIKFVVPSNKVLNGTLDSKYQYIINIIIRCRKHSGLMVTKY